MAKVNTERCRKKLLGDHYIYNGDINGPRSGNPLSCNMETLTELLCFFTSLLLLFSNINLRESPVIYISRLTFLVFYTSSNPRLHFPQ